MKPRVSTTVPETPPRISTIDWEGNAAGTLLLLDQTLLPTRVEPRRIDTLDEVIDAIRRLVVRGAPAIGVTAGYGAVLIARTGGDGYAALREGLPRLRAARPTAVNLQQTVDRIAALVARLEREGTPTAKLSGHLLDEARTIHAEDVGRCESMGQHGAELLTDGMTLLTHCNTGRLATGGIGTALGVITTAFHQGKRLDVYAGETRPLLQGARLTAFELAEVGIPCTLLADSAGAGLIGSGEIDAVLVGADRIAANGDTANKVGTLPLALAASHFGVPFYVVAPTTTLDTSIADGTAIPIEGRGADEILDALGPNRVPAGISARNPAFDVTPNALVTALVTERGVIHHPTTESIKPLGAPSR